MKILTGFSLFSLATATPLLIWPGKEFQQLASEIPAITSDVVTHLHGLGCPKLSLIIDDPSFDTQSLRKQDSAAQVVVQNAKSVIAIPYVDQENVPEEITGYLIGSCGATIVNDVDQALLETGRILLIVPPEKWNDKLELLKEKVGDDFVVFYTSGKSHKLEKRAVSQAQSTNYTALPYEKRPLFQRFLFFNNAVFMGILVFAILIPILAVAINSLASIKGPTKFEAKKKGE